MNDQSIFKNTANIPAVPIPTALLDRQRWVVFQAITIADTPHVVRLIGKDVVQNIVLSGSLDLVFAYICHFFKVTPLLWQSIVQHRLLNTSPQRLFGSQARFHHPTPR